MNLANQNQRVLKIEGVCNIRDLGGYQTAYGATQWRKIFRSDSLHAIDGQGIDQLLKLGLKTVIDLRQPEETKHEPNQLSFVPEIKYHNVSVFEQIYPTQLQQENPDILLEIYLQALREAEALVDVLNKIADADPNGGVLFHCSAGKDRTGIVAAMILTLAGASKEVVLEDYLLTADLIQPRLIKIIENAQSRGDVDMASFQRLLACDRRIMESALDHLVHEYGSIYQYLSHKGLSTEAIDKIRKRIV